mgnify:CR=1 FL=1
MSYTCFDVEISDQVAHVRMIRPEKRNSMNPAFWEELPTIIKDIDHNVRARVIVISSTGPHFCSGLDISSFTSAGTPPKLDQETIRRNRIARGASFYQDCQRSQDSISSIENCRIPVLVAVQGGAIGGGVDITTAWDIRYACEGAFFTVYEINIGMTADVGTFPRLVKLIPEGIVRELCYTGRRMPANEAKQVGLVNEVYADQETMLESVMAVAREIAGKAPLAVHGCKRMITYARDHSTLDGLDYISIWNASMLQTEEMSEAITSSREDRSGDFVDLPVIKGRR